MEYLNYIITEKLRSTAAQYLQKSGVPLLFFLIFPRNLRRWNRGAQPVSYKIYWHVNQERKEIPFIYINIYWFYNHITFQSKAKIKIDNT